MFPEDLSWGWRAALKSPATRHSPPVATARFTFSLIAASMCERSTRLPASDPGGMYAPNTCNGGECGSVSITCIRRPFTAGTVGTAFAWPHLASVCLTAITTPSHPLVADATHQ